MTPLRGKAARALVAALDAARPRKARPKRRAKLPGPREREVVRAVLQYLAACRVKAWRTNAGTQYAAGLKIALAPPGTADVIGLLDGGRFLAIECKRPGGGRLSTPQKRWRHEVEALGGLVIEARSCREVYDALRAAGCDVPAPDARLL